MTVTMTKPAAQRSADVSADTAADLLNAMAAMPVGHPSRAALRDRAI